MFPLFSWLPDSYPTAPTTITAVFAGPLRSMSERAATELLDVEQYVEHVFDSAGDGP